MTDKESHRELTPIFTKLRAILQRHEKSYSVIDDSEERYGLGGPPGPATLRAWRGKIRTPVLPLAWVEIGKSSVSFHLMGMEHPSLAKRMSKALSAQKQGKTCFHFKHDDPALFDELEELTVKGLAGMKKAGIVAALALCIVGSVLGAVSDPLPRSAPEAIGLSATTLSDATALLRQFVAERKIAGAVAGVARKGKLAYLEAVGVQDLETRTPMTERSLFRIYSMTKSFTSVAAMILYEEGRFGLKDPVSKYLPEFRNVVVASADGSPRKPAGEITVEDLMLHTSGLSHRTAEVYRAAKVRSRTMTLPQFIGNIVRVPLMEDPGTRYRYSEGTTVLGRLVEVWSGKSFDVFMQERVIRPLGLTDTGFWAAGDQRARLTTVYAPAAGGGLTPVELEDVPFSERPALVEGAVGLLSSVPDYLRFSQMLLNKGELDGVRLLTAKTVDMITSNGLSDAVLKARGGPMGWGLANVNVLLDPSRSNPPANKGEYGWDGTAGTIFWIDPTTEMITVLMTQSSPANPDGIRQKFKTIVQQAITN